MLTLLLTDQKIPGLISDSDLVFFLSEELLHGN